MKSQVENHCLNRKVAKRNNSGKRERPTPTTHVLRNRTNCSTLPWPKRISVAKEEESKKLSPVDILESLRLTEGLKNNPESLFSCNFDKRYPKHKKKDCSTTESEWHTFNNDVFSQKLNSYTVRPDKKSSSNSGKVWISCERKKPLADRTRFVECTPLQKSRQKSIMDSSSSSSTCSTPVRHNHFL